MWHTQHTLETTAQPDAIWRRWADLGSWPQWDEQLDSVRLEGPLRAGSAGVLMRLGRSIPFTVLQVEEGRALVLQAKRTFSCLRLVHRLEESPLGSRVTHRLEVEGPLAWWLKHTLGRSLGEGLPPAMRRLARVAHQG